MMHRRAIMLLMSIAGAVLLIGGIAGLCSLYAESHEYERTTATVRSIQTQKVYRGRKLRYHSKMLISYRTQRYGEVSVAATSYCPVRRKGDKVTVWYRPDHPRDIRLPRAECCIWGMLAAAGLICLGGGMVVRKSTANNLNNN